MPEQESQYAPLILQLSALIGNALIVTFNFGDEHEREHVFAPIKFVQVKTLWSAQARREGLTLFSITSEDGILAQQFPATMVIALPTTAAREIIGAVFSNRKYILDQLREQQVVAEVTQKEEIDDQGEDLEEEEFSSEDFDDFEDPDEPEEEE